MAGQQQGGSSLGSDLQSDVPEGTRFCPKSLTGKRMEFAVFTKKMLRDLCKITRS